ncbi:hypothetical protein, partial [Burkholderia cenocepacia]|uniref:hypothetical protein n=1 Tax=Burkholderia cenocepacia TaxID=95486 RepID=UPI0006AC1D20
MPAALYQLTATAAQMCLPVAVPAAAPDGFLDLLDHWQTLIGATAGGLLGVAGAWIVAVSARRRERRIAAGMILPDLQQLTAAGMHLNQNADTSLDVTGADVQGSAKARAAYVVGKLGQRRPKVFALHTPAIGQLSDIDERLTAHLFLCQMIHRGFEDAIEVRLAHIQRVTEALATNRRPVMAVVSTESRIYDEWRHCVEHAMLANYFLDRFLFSRW